MFASWMAGTRIPGLLSLLVVLVLAPGLALLALWVTHATLDRLLRRKDMLALRRMLAGGRGAVQVAVALLAVQLALPQVLLSPEVVAAASRFCTLGLVIAIGWAATRKMAAVFDACMVGKLAEDADWLQRRRRTQLIVFRRLAVSAGVVVTIGLVLTSIPAVRAIGLSLFASAGIAGIIAGVAARPAVSNLIAGIQLALTQPFRLGDAIVVDGDWGHVSEITATYVTISTWDQRSLVVPLGYFLDHPIRNWTKTSAELLDTVFIHVDFTLPVEAVRVEARRLLDATTQWDRRVFALQVTDLTERSMELRLLMSAANADSMFDLRCIMREQLMAFLVAHYPLALPQDRLGGAAPATGSGTAAADGHRHVAAIL